MSIKTISEKVDKLLIYKDKIMGHYNKSDVKYIDFYVKERNINIYI